MSSGEGTLVFWPFIPMESIIKRRQGESELKLLMSLGHFLSDFDEVLA